MFCPKCGSKNEDASRFCASCGEALPQPQPAPAPQPVRVQQAPNTRVAAHAGAAAAPAVRKTPYGAIAAIIIAVAIVIAAAIIMVPRMTAGNGGATGVLNLPGNQATAIEGVQPAIVDNGNEIRALARPFILDLTNIDIDAQPVEAEVGKYQVDADLGNVSNLDDVYLSDEQKEYIADNGFVIEAGTGQYEFYEQYEHNRYGMIPSFVTVDSMMHTYHLYFSHLMKNSEKYYLSDQLKTVSAAMLDASMKQAKALEGTEWESAAWRNVAFFSVGMALLDDDGNAPAAVAETVKEEVDRVEAAEGMATSSLFTTDADNPVIEDYTQYKPRGYYEGDEDLERYFRAMMWYGRANFTQKDEDLDRSAMLMTMALDEGAFSGWESIYMVTSFFAGASDDCGYYEYRPLIDAAYGEGATVDALAGDGAAWTHYHALTAQMPAPQINSVVVMDTGEGTDHEAEEKGYRFMGQRFTIDAAIMQNLVYNKVGENASGDKRMMPDALDVPAALGSDEALSILEERGATGFDGYSENMQKLRDVYTADDPALWQASLYAQWLHTLQPLLDAKGEGYPAFMQSSAWSRKNLQSYLGSYTELKHDTVLYSKQVMVEMGGGPVDKDDRGYVEPEPAVYARLAALTKATSDGLAGYGLLATGDADNLKLLQQLAEKLQVIAEKELREEALTDDEYELIRTYGGQLEHFWQEVYKEDATSERFTGRDFPAAVVVDVATNPDSQAVLELGTGKVSKIQVVVPVDGELRVAVGAVYSFYQFEQPMSERLTDTEWREMMGIEAVGGTTYNKPDKHVEDWTSDFQYESSW